MTEQWISTSTQVKRMNDRWPRDVASWGGAPGGNSAVGYKGKRR